jgi:hypothetical protein
MYVITGSGLLQKIVIRIRGDEKPTDPDPVDLDPEVCLPYYVSFYDSKGYCWL